MGSSIWIAAGELIEMNIVRDREYSRDSRNYPTSERYTDEANRALSYARQECLRRGQRVLTAADLLAGLSVEESSRAQRVGSLKENAFYLRWLTALPPLPERSPVTSRRASEEIEPDIEVKQALEFALVEANRDREDLIDSDHLLRGIMRFPNKAHFALLKTEINLTSVRIASYHDRREFTRPKKAGFNVWQYLFHRSTAH
jgi:ATP-dependent Clp protease ATP-binding subunit ClpA